MNKSEYPDIEVELRCNHCSLGYDFFILRKADEGLCCKCTKPATVVLPFVPPWPGGSVSLTRHADGKLYWDQVPKFKSFIQRTA